MEDEWLDVVDDNDCVIGKESRNKVYDGIKPLKNIRVVNILVFNPQGKLLLPKRSLNRRIFPGCYDLSCGEHVQSGEEYHSAAVRGIREELGIENPKLIDLGKLTPREGVSAFMHVYKFIFDGDLSKYDREGIDTLEWYDLKQALILVKKNPEKCKSDLPIILNWYSKL